MDLCLAPTLACTLFVGMASARHEMDWNIAADLSGTLTPNILSELEYQRMRSRGLTVGGAFDTRLSATWPWRLIGELSYSGSDLGDGRYRDSDYGNDDRSGLFSQSVGDVSDGRYQRFSGRVGLLRELFGGRHLLGVELGFDWSDLDTLITNGVQTVPADGPFAGLRTSFDTEWESGSLALSYRFQPQGKGALFAAWAYYEGTYFATANWNLRTDFAHPVSFIHSADQEGQGLRIGYQSALDSRWGWQLLYEWREMEAKAGIDRTFFSSGAIGDTRLNRTRWESESISVILQRRF